MRKLFLSVFVCFLMINVSLAQFETGKKIIAGGLNFTTSSEGLNSNPAGSQKNTSFLLNVSLSHFSSPLSVKGFGIAYGYTRTRSNISNPSIEQLNYAHTVGAFVNRTKLQPLGKDFYLSFTGNLSASYGFGRSAYLNATNYSDRKSYGIGLGGSMGVWYRLTQRFILSCDISNLLYVNYNYGTYTTHNGTAVHSGNNNSFGIGTGLNGFNFSNLAVGVRYILKN